MPRRTDSNNPGDWLWIANEELKAIGVLVERETGYSMCRGQLAESLCDSLGEAYFATRYPGFEFEDADWVRAPGSKTPAQALVIEVTPTKERGCVLTIISTVRSRDQRKLLMRNLGKDNHWLKLELRGTTSNADANRRQGPGQGHDSGRGDVAAC